jgi:hypothetical protein
VCSSLNVTDQVPHPYKKGKITVGYSILYFTYLYSRNENKTLTMPTWKLNEFKISNQNDHSTLAGYARTIFVIQQTN